MKIGLLFWYLIFTGFLPARAFAWASDNVSDTIPQKIKKGGKEKLYCSSYAKTKYKLLITGSKIKITRLYKEFTEVTMGVFKKGKIYSNNPDEQKVKEARGKYYKLQGNAFGVLNMENGDYDWFTLCKDKL